MYGVEVGLGSSEENIEAFLFQLPNVTEIFLRVNIFFSPFFEHFLLKLLSLQKSLECRILHIIFVNAMNLLHFFVSLDCT